MATKSAATIKAEAESLLPDNLTRAISAGDVRVRITDIADKLAELELFFASSTHLAAARVLSTVSVSVASAPEDIDSVTMAENDRVLLTGQANPEQNGVWLYNGDAVAMTRPADFPTGRSFKLATVDITEGTHAGKTYQQSAAGVVDTNDQIWAELTSTASGHQDRLEIGETTTRQVTLLATPVTKVVGFTQYGRAIMEDYHFTVAGTTVTFTDDGLLDGTKVTLSYESAAAPVVTERTSVEFDTADGTVVNLLAVSAMEVQSSNTNSAFTTSGGKTDLMVVNRKATAITVNGLDVDGLQSVDQRYFGGAWSIVMKYALSLLLACFLFGESKAQEDFLTSSNGMQTSARSRTSPTVAGLTSLDIQEPLTVVDGIADGEFVIVPYVGRFWYDDDNAQTPNADTVVDAGTLGGNFIKEFLAAPSLTTAQLGDADVFWLPTGHRVVVYDTTTATYKTAVGGGAGVVVTLSEFLVADATPSTSGLMSAADKTKIDALAATNVKFDVLDWSVAVGVGTVTLTESPANPEAVIFHMLAGAAYQATASAEPGVYVTLSGAGNQTATINAADLAVPDGQRVIVIYEY